MEVRSLAEWVDAGTPDLLSVVIPAHNEEGHIEGTVRSLAAALATHAVPHEIIVVNDNSRDQTAAIVARLGQQFPGVRCLNNAPPNGFGFAVRRGLAEFRGQWVALMMADGSDSPEDLVAFYKKARDGYDCVFGSRFLPGGRVSDYPWPKLVLNRLGNLLIRALFRCRYNDATNAFKLYGRHVIAGIQPLLSYHFNLLVELPLKSIVRGYRYAVIPNSWRNRTTGLSKFKVKEMGSRYLFIIAYCLAEKHFAQGDYRAREDLYDKQLQVWHR